MTQQLAEATGSWRVRFTIALVLLLAAAGTVFSMQRDAEAVLPISFAELDQEPDGPASGIVPGEVVTYTVLGYVSASEALQDESLAIELFSIDTTNFIITDVEGNDPGTGTPGNCTWSGASAGCHWHNVDSNLVYILTVTGVATGNAGDVITQPSARMCDSEDGATDDEMCDDTGETGVTGQVQATDTDTVSGATTDDAGDLTLGWPEDSQYAQNAIGAEHTFSSFLPEGADFTSDSDPDDICDSPVLGTDIVNESGDPPVAIVSAVVTDSSTDDNGDGTGCEFDLTVVSDLPGPYTFTVYYSFHNQSSEAPDEGDAVEETEYSFTLTKEYVGVEDAIGGDACIRHVDSDLYHESEAAAEDGFGQNFSEYTGVLWDDFEDCDSQVDDPDQARGGPHYACIFDTALTFSGNGGDITWTITGPPAAEAVTPLSFQEIVGPWAPDWPCVHWSSADVGDQSIFATYDPDGPGGVAGVNIFSDGTPGQGGAQPLVKEWNTIDETWLIEADGEIDYPGGNTGELDCWTDACSSDNRDNIFGGRENVDGAEYTVWGELSSDGEIFVDDELSFIDYVLGQHDAYNGPIDGALQTYWVDGDCGYIEIEDPTSGTTLEGTGPFEILSSDKGIAFTIIDDQDCEPGDSTTVYISTEEYIDYDSPIDTADDESVTVIWQARTFSKQPMFLWAGQRAVLEHDWREPDGDCDVAELDDEYSDYFNVLYSLQNQSGGSFLGLEEWDEAAQLNDVDISGMDAMVEVYAFEDGDDPNADCISRIGFENQDPGEVDIIAQIVEDDSDFPTADPVEGPAVAFLLYYMKFEDLELSIVAGERVLHNDGDFSDGNPWDTSTDEVDVASNVSADVLVRARVRGWIPCAATQFGGVANCTTREAGVDTNGGLLPQWRVVLPDDYRFLAGGNLAEELSPNYDVMIDPAVETGEIDCDVDENDYVDGLFSDGLTCETPYPLWDPSAGSQVHDYVSGPPSLLDGWYESDVEGSKAPSALPIGDAFRDTILPDRVINGADWIAPVAEIRFSIEGSGFLKPATKGDGDNSGNNVYWLGENPYYVTQVPAEPWLSPINERGGGYEWDTWGSDGSYWFWQPVEMGDVVYSAPGADDDKLDNDDLTKKGGPEAYIESGALLSDDDGGLDSTETQVGLTAPGGIANGDIIRIESENMLVVSGGGTTSLVVVRYQDDGDAGPVTHPNGQKVKIFTGGEETGYDSLYVYSDNHGEAMVWANGDAGLTMDECQGGVGDDGVGDGTVVSIDGYLCQVGDLVGTSTISASVHYPDFQKHFPLASNDVTVDWEWGGHKYVTVEDDPDSEIFKYVVLHLADRDGYCGENAPTLGSPSLHPVLGEPVRFVIDGNPTGGIPIEDAAQLGSITANGYQADVVTFDTWDTDIEPVFEEVDGECQAWVKLSNSLLGVINIKVTAWDPEGTITWDVLVDFTGESEPLDLAAGWNLVVWPGEDGIAPDAGLAAGDPDLTGNVSAIYGWIAATQTWLSYFPLEDDIPAELQTLTSLETGEAYWMYLLEAVDDWTVPTNQD